MNHIFDLLRIDFIYKCRHFEDKGHWWTFAKKREVRRWVLTLITGFICGVVALFVTFFTKILTHFKFHVFHGLIEKEKSGEIVYGAGFFFLLCCNCLFVIVAWVTVYVEPLAGGSGISIIQTALCMCLCGFYLNSMNPKLLNYHITTLLPFFQRYRNT